MIRIIRCQQSCKAARVMHCDVFHPIMQGCISCIGEGPSCFLFGICFAGAAAAGQILNSRSRPLPAHPRMKYFREETLAVDTEDRYAAMEPNQTNFE